MTLLQDSEIDALTSGSPFGQPPQSKYVPPVITVVAYPCHPGPTVHPFTALGVR